MKTTGGSAASRSPSPMSVDEVPDRPPSQPANNVPDEPYEAPRDVAPAPAPPTRRPASPTVNTWTVNGQLRASNNSTLTFRPPPRPWYRTKPATIALIAAASAAVAVPVVMLVLRSSPATGPEESTSVAPQASTSAQPAPSSAPAHSDQRSPAAATTSPASAATSDRGHRLRGYPAVPMDAPRRTVANGEAGHRGDAHTRDPGADQCGATAAATTRKQLGHPRGRTQALGPVVTTIALFVVETLQRD